MLVAWHPTRWWDWCMSEEEQKEIESFLLMKSSMNFGQSLNGGLFVKYKKFLDYDF